MKEKKSAPVGIPPKLSKELAVHKWIEQFAQDLEEVYGTHDAPLTYMTRTDVATPANIATAPRAVDQPYAKIYTSIQEEMKFCLSHTHNLTKADIAAALFLISVGWTSYNNESNINIKNQPIEFSDTITVPTTENIQVQYELIGYVLFTGDKRSGHYRVICRGNDDHWFLYNDQDTTELNVKERANDNCKWQVVL